MTQHPTRRELLKPVQLVGFALLAAVFGLLITAMSLGAFQDLPAASIAHTWTVALIVGGIIFIVALIALAMMMLAINPADVTRTIDKPVLIRDEDGDSSGSPADPSE